MESNNRSVITQGMILKNMDGCSKYLKIQDLFYI